MKKAGFTALALLFVFMGQVWAGIPSGQLIFTITPAVSKETKDVKLWIPYPLSNAFQTISDMKVTGNYDTSAVYRDPSSQAVYLYASWTDPKAQPQCVMRFRISQKDRRNKNIVDSGKDYPELVAPYLASTAAIPVDDPEMKAIAEKAIKGKTGNLDKARAVYDWVVENTFRDPDVKGCGLGIATRTLKQCKGGGKCADLFRCVLQKNARTVNLDGSDQTLDYFMYPAAQVDGTMLNYFDPESFSYKVELKLDN